jgi:8-oxo-dGTP diphosphatase
VRDGRVLVARRREGQHLAGTWEFPGGKLRPGEEPSDGALRELVEETGLSGSTAEPLLVFVHDYPDRRLRFHAFLVPDAEGEVVTDGGRPFEWVDPAALHDRPMPDANRAILRALRWRLS